MKPMNGLTFVHTLRVTQPSSSNTPAVMVSARTGEATVRNALDAGVDHFLSKPIDPTALYNALSLATGKWD
jgi:CheY-like chemotaxis protein